MKKISVILLSLCCLTLVGCGATPAEDPTPPPEDIVIVNDPTPADDVVYMTDEELVTWAEANLPKAMAIQNIFCGDALPYDDTDAAQSEDDFVPTTNSEYPTIAALKAATEAIYTKDYAAETLYSEAFDSDKPLYKEMDGKLCVNPDVAAKNIEDAFDFATLTYVSAEEGVMKFKVQSKTEKETSYEITIRSMVGDNWLIEGFDFENQ